MISIFQIQYRSKILGLFGLQESTRAWSSAAVEKNLLKIDRLPGILLSSIEEQTELFGMLDAARVL
jgi:hypothetical protein